MSLALDLRPESLGVDEITKDLGGRGGSYADSEAFYDIFI